MFGNKIVESFYGMSYVKFWVILFTKTFFWYKYMLNYKLARYKNIQIH